tara:strand:+ start:1926 stop:2099 length:174 start_codon:yes stop_codon:yes gene_type:complete
MAWSVHTWKILRIFQSQFLSGEVCAETRHSSYTQTLATIKKHQHRKYRKLFEKLKEK